MVWLTKWIRESKPDARVLIITDREELDQQIEKVYKGVQKDIYRMKNGRDLLDNLNDTSPWLMCSLIHKFGGKEEVDEKDVEKYLSDLTSGIPTDYRAKGDISVFVDECRRTQSGKLHEAMKQFIPDAIFIGFTGTPLLKTDRQTSLEVFGRYIHTYKFDEAVHDGVVLDLRYEARDVEQKITSADKIDEWFDLKTRGLMDFWQAFELIESAVFRLIVLVYFLIYLTALLAQLELAKASGLALNANPIPMINPTASFKASLLLNCGLVLISACTSMCTPKWEKVSQSRYATSILLATSVSILCLILIFCRVVSL